MPILAYFLLFACLLQGAAHANNTTAVSEECLNNLQKADARFDAALYAGAIPLYKSVLQAMQKDDPSNDDVESHARYRLAQAYFLTNDYAAAIALLSAADAVGSDNETYLLALTYSRAGRRDDAIIAFAKYLNAADPSRLNFIDEAQLEMGQAYFHLERLSDARRSLEKVSNKTTRLKILAALYLARIDLAEAHCQSAEERLNSLIPDLSLDDPFRYEVAYLRGEISFQMQEYAKAAAYFSQALPSSHPERAAWSHDALHHLGWCYIKMAESPLADPEAQRRYFDQAEAILQKLLVDSSDEKILLSTGEYAPAMLELLGTHYYQQQKYVEAEKIFVKLAADFPNSSQAGNSLYWAARCADNLQETEKSKSYRKQVFMQYPNSSFAPEAYFSHYSYHDYLQGDRIAIKHLQALPDKYPNDVHLIHAWYLIGLDNKRDRKTAEGKWIRKKNLTAAIDAFQKAESTFDSLYQAGTLKTESLARLAAIRYRAAVERALANLAIADESQGAKRQIYLEYAQDAFIQIVNDFKDPTHALHLLLTAPGPCRPIQEESMFGLAQAYSKGGHDEKAEAVLTEMLEKYQSAKTTRSYYLSRVWCERGLIAKRRKEYAAALQCLQQAEDAAKGRVLSGDQKLDLWIQQSFCYLAQNKSDEAILILSKVINDDAISSLRVKAMYLRAEAYEAQGRQELARRQLEATSKNGGEWALKAKQKLEKDYYAN